jgi:large repetitive protein
MVAIFTGLGSGFERGSAAQLGGSGMLGSSVLGRTGQQLFLNAATGNLVVQQQDEFLVGRGPDVAIGRTYNSLGNLTDENGDNWRQNTDRRLFGLTGTANQAGSTIKRRSADGSEITYSYNVAAAAYLTTDGAGAHDKLVHDGVNSWKWTDGSSQVTETYGPSSTAGQWWITEQKDSSGNALAFTYTSGRLTRVATADGGYTDYGWDVANNRITQIVTGYLDLAQAGTPARTLTRTRYAYDAQNRLSTVTVDLTPGDNSIAAGKVFSTHYAYHGSSTRIASIAQSDGTRVDIDYVLKGSDYLVSEISQWVDDVSVRQSRL